MAVRFALFALLALSCSKEPPLSSDSPKATTSDPAGKATDDCALCSLFGAFNEQQEEEETAEEAAATDSTSSVGGPDLIVQSPLASAVVLTSGQAFILNVTVHNQGDQQAAATMLRYYRSNNSTISASDTEVGTGSVDALDASATSEESIGLTASVGVERYYGACVESVSGESNTDNNCSSAVKITVSGQEATEDEETEEDEEEKDEAGSTTSITLTARPTTLREDDGETSITITATLDGTVREENTEVLVAISSLSTATRDLDYAALFTPSITIPAGSLSGSIKFYITPIADSLQEGSESIQLIGVIEGLSTFVEITLSDSHTGPSQPIESSQDGDREALVALYHATGGDDWTNNDGWLSDRPITEWYGVDGNFIYIQGKFYEGPSPYGLFLYGNNLSGTIPAELGNLKNLRRIELQDNKLSGSIPSELAQLDSLRTLWLGNNKLSGTVPPQLGDLSNLIVANLAGNDLTGCLPSQWKDNKVDPGKGGFPLPFCGDTGGPSGEFDIELVYLDNGLSSAQKNLMAKAARRWEEIIIGDLPDINFRGFPYNEWDDSLQARIRVSDTVDDVRIFVRVLPIASQSTTGNPTAGTGFTFQVRASDSLPVLSAVLLNSDLLDEVEAAGQLEKLMLHELGHCLGVGISWYHFGLLYNSSRQNYTADTYFAGFQARRAFDQLGGRSYQGRKVPVQQGGDDVHWRTSVFGDELMTLGWTWPYHAPLSRITVASLDDIGYEVNLDAADAYRVPSTSVAKPVATEALPRCSVVRRPIHVVAEDGRVLETIDP